MEGLLVVILLAVAAFIIYALVTKEQPPQPTPQPPQPAKLVLTDEQQARVRAIAAQVGMSPQDTLQKLLCDSTIQATVDEKGVLPPVPASFTIVRADGLILANDLAPHLGFVYFIETVTAPYRLKIGWAYDPHDRLKQLQTGSPQPLRLIGARVGTKEYERGLHQRFAGLRGVGEWFQETPELRAALGLPPRSAESPTQVAQ